MAKELSLEEKLAASLAELDAVKSGLVETETKLEKATQVIAEKETALATATAELEATKSVNESLTAEIEKLSDTSSIVSDAKAGLSFEIDGKKYGFEFHQMNHKGKTITSEDVVSDEALQAELIKIKSGMIVEA